MRQHLLAALVAATLAACGAPETTGTAADTTAADTTAADTTAADDTAAGDTAAGDTAADTTAADDTNDERAEGPAPESLRAYVDPFIGTGGHGWYAGNSLVGASLPFGLVQASPDTTNDELHWPFDHCSGYHADDDRLLYISHTHLHGTGIPELGSVGFRPQVGPVEAAALGDSDIPGPHIDKPTESARPGYYAVTLTDSQLRIELTATERAAMHRYTPPDGTSELSVLVDAGWTLIPGVVHDRTVELIDASRELTAWTHSSNAFSEADRGVHTFVAARFDRDPTSSGVTDDGRFAWATFDVTDGAPLQLAVGVSYVSADQARANLAAEIPGDATFDSVLAAAEAAWEAQLSIVRCSGMSDTQRTVLATSLYHALLMPNLISDADGTYPGFDDITRVDDDARHYTNLSLWDTYRTLHPLLSLTHPEVQRDVVVSLLAMADQGGWLPKWPVANGYSNVMIGGPADIVIAESYLKGIHDFDVEGALEHMVRMATEAPPSTHPYEGRGGIASYVANGWVADELHGESVSRTLEFCAADYAIAQLAAELGEADLAAEYDLRSLSYVNQWDSETGFFRPRNSDGTWTDFDPMATGVLGSYTEGNANQYTWMVLHDPVGLADLMGGVEAAAERLETFMAAAGPERAEILEGDHDVLYWLTTMPTTYWHGNEPDIHAAWLFIELGRPDLAAGWLRWIQDELYGTGVTGIPGNDDAGTLAAWYLFATLGIYPIPGSDRYLVGTPAFDHCELDLPGGTVVFDAPGASTPGGWTTSATVDGEPVEGHFVRHEDLVDGAHLQFDLTWE